ncbi:MAG TPA: hypothetical protein VME66_16515 [Candidatus Acidoferrales bacterium]|nr:hypothetical protein [Candidatus Acidoferrales bacterium]
MKTSRFIVSIAVGASLVSACGGNSSSVPKSPAIAQPSPLHAQQKNVTISLHIPGPAAATSSERSPKYVSASTESVAVVVQPGNDVVDFDTSATANPNCTASASGTTCTATVDAPIGTDSFTFSTYDQPLDPAGSPSGNLLSTGTTSQTIAAGTATTVNVTLNGVVSSIGVSVPNDALLVGTASQQPIVVTAYDADGNAIVGPGSYVDANGSPLGIAVADSDPSETTALSSGTVTAPSSAITLNYNGDRPFGRYPTITVSATGLTSASVRAVITPAFLITNTTWEPEGMIVGPDGNLYVNEDGQGGTLVMGVLTASGTFVEQDLDTTLDGMQITLGGDGRFWMSTYGEGGYILAINPSLTGGVAIYSSPSNPFNYPDTDQLKADYGDGAIVTGADGNVYLPGLEYSDETTGAAQCALLQEVVAEGRVNTFGYPVTSGAPSCGAYNATLGSDQNIWWSQMGAGTGGVLYKGTTSGTITPYNIPGTEPTNIISCPDGNIWMTGAQHNGPLGTESNSVLIKATTGGAMTTYPIPAQYGLATGAFACDSYGNIWFSATQGLVLASLSTGATQQIFSLPAEGSSAITASVPSVLGPDGALYYLVQDYNVGYANTGSIVKVNY